MEDIRKRQGDFIRQRRNAMSRTQKWLAEATRTSERTVMRAEKGEGLSAENMLAFCSALGVDVSEVPREPRPDAEGNQRLRTSLVARVLHDLRGAARRLADQPTRRHVAASLSIALTVALGFNAWYGFQRFRIADQAFELYSLWAASDVAGLLAKVEAALPEASPDGVALMIASSSSRLYQDCSGVSWFGRLTQTASCRKDPVTVRQRVASPGRVEIEYGPTSRMTYLATAALLTRNPTVRAEMAVVPAGAFDAGPRTFWFDPRGVDPESLPRFADGDAMVVRLTREIRP